MAIKKILIPIHGTGVARSAQEAGFNIAAELNAHVEVLHVRPNPKDAVPLLGEGMSGAMIEEMVEIAETEATDRADKARDTFEELCKTHSATVTDKPMGEAGRTASWVDKTGREDEITTVRGRLADLIVVARPSPDADLAVTMTLNAALVDTGRPVLVVPPGMTVESLTDIGHKITISWNGSAEAGRAVAAAMPIIHVSDHVRILTADSEHSRAAEGAPELARYLAWHGVTADIQTVHAGNRIIGELLLKECTDAGANLLVLGAYTHSRLRQLVFGGVTRHVLANADLPLFMVH